ncbi:hypothetical protein OMK64_19560, partial [Cellulomonas fimi]|nr:hypothetical protein [Cellulomonas fimi]
DAGAESPGESGCRWAVLRDGFPVPLTQVPVPTRLGTFWLDLGWPEWSVGIEYDGRVKYRTHDDLVHEKRRHDAITEAGWRVVRVTAEDRPTRAGLTNRLAPLLPATVTTGLRPRVDLAR